MVQAGVPRCGDVHADHVLDRILELQTAQTRTDQLVHLEYGPELAAARRTLMKSLRAEPQQAENLRDEVLNLNSEKLSLRDPAESLLMIDALSAVRSDLAIEIMAHLWRHPLTHSRFEWRDAGLRRAFASRAFGLLKSTAPIAQKLMLVEVLAQSPSARESLRHENNAGRVLRDLLQQAPAPTLPLARLMAEFVSLRQAALRDQKAGDSEIPAMDWADAYVVSVLARMKYQDSQVQTYFAQKASELLPLGESRGYHHHARAQALLQEFGL